MGQNSTKKQRNIIIASIIIVVLVVSSIGAVIIYNQLTATRISLSLSTNQTEVIQGSSSQIQVNVDLKGNPENTTLTAMPNLTSINCSFAPATGSSSFNSTLTINVPDSTPTGNYSLIVGAASSDTTIANASCIVSVEGKNVTVSGQIHVTSNVSLDVDSLQFEDTRTMAIYSVIPSFAYYGGEYTNNFYSYTIVLSNEETYNVTVNFHWGVADFNPFAESGSMGNLTVFAPAGSDTMQGQDFSYAHLGA